MKELHFSVTDKVAEYEKQDGTVVCGNKDYRAVFNFNDTCWSGKAKTARFIWNRQYVEVPLENDACTMPTLDNTTSCQVGVFSDDGVCATTNATVPCLLSVKCGSAAPLPFRAPEWKTVFEKEMPWEAHYGEDGEEPYSTAGNNEDPEIMNADAIETALGAYTQPVLVRAIFDSGRGEINHSAGGQLLFALEANAKSYESDNAISGLVGGEMGGPITGVASVYTAVAITNPANGYTTDASKVYASWIESGDHTGKTARFTLQVAMLDGKPYDPTV